MLYTPVFHIDANLINARGKLDTMNQIEKWAHNGVILVNMSNVSFNQVQMGNDRSRIKKAFSNIFTIIDENCNESDPIFQKIAQALFPNGLKKDNEKSDVKIVWDAVKWQAILITNDGASKRQPGGILGNKHKLKNMLSIMRDTEAVEFIRKKIIERDELNIKIHELTGEVLPQWIGKD